MRTSKHISYRMLLYFFIIVSFSSGTPHELNSYNIADRTERGANLNDIMNFRIVGGTDASIKDFPYMVSLQNSFNHICGGTIVTKYFVLTAAHCVTSNEKAWKIVDPMDLNVIAGQSILDVGECQLRDVRKLYVHLKYDTSTLKNDVALVAVFEPFEWTKFVQSVTLHSSNHISFGAYEYCTVAGWGIVDKQPTNVTRIKLAENSVLQQVDLPPSTEPTCRKYFTRYHNQLLFDETKLCIILAGGKDTCFGDSGGPLICGGIQYGITSFGFGCAQAHMYGVYVNVSFVKNWIDTTMSQNHSLVSTRHVEKMEMPRGSLPVVGKSINFSENMQNISQLHTIWNLSTILFYTIIMFKITIQ